jgi:acetyltransferase-like isoleucine patch superfamily enzyme
MSWIGFVIAKGLRKLILRPAILCSRLEKTSRVCSGSQIYYSMIGKYSYIGNECKVINTDIKAFCSIADGCYIGGAQHDMSRVSTSPVFHAGRNIMHTNFTDAPALLTKRISIGNDVWIGAHCLIKSGVIIGDGAVIGMGSVVTHNVEPYTIVAGNPARMIRKRFDDDTIKLLANSEWWKLKDEDLLKIAPFFDNVPCFLKELNN